MHSAQSMSSVGLSYQAGVDDIQVALDNGVVCCVSSGRSRGSHSDVSFGQSILILRLDELDKIKKLECAQMFSSCFISSHYIYTGYDQGPDC